MILAIFEDAFWLSILLKLIALLHGTALAAWAFQIVMTVPDGFRIVLKLL